MYFGNITISHHFDSVRTVWSLIANSSSQKDAPPQKIPSFEVMKLQVSAVLLICFWRLIESNFLPQENLGGM